MANSKKPILVVMAAGMGSRFGGLKQIEAVGPCGEAILDYSLYDARRAGFETVVFIIKHAIEDAFKASVGARAERAGFAVRYAYQELDLLPQGYAVPEGRAKPWGTAHAILSAADVIDAPFAVINADDYYGKSIYREIHHYLCADHPGNAFCMAGFILKNTLSDNGTVTRGICQVDGKGFLSDVVETKNIRPTANGAEADGKALDPDGYVSMNMWGLSPAFLETLERNFKTFFETDVPANPLKAEYLLPILIGQLLQRKEVTVQVLPTHDKWFGVTYAADKAAVTESFAQLIAQGVYGEDLYADL